MQMLPDFEIGIVDAWLPLVLYLVGFVLMVATFPSQDRVRLFEDPKTSMPAGVRFVRLLGQGALLACIGMMALTPLNLGTPAFAVGVPIYALGYTVVIVALRYFRDAPDREAAAAGPYRVSRNPQWVGLVLVFAGAAVMTGVWLYLVIILGVTIVYHLQILGEERRCLEQYGDRYQAYMEQVPRYLLLL